MVGCAECAVKRGVVAGAGASGVDPDHIGGYEDGQKQQEAHDDSDVEGDADAGVALLRGSSAPQGRDGQDEGGDGTDEAEERTAEAEERDDGEHERAHGHS